MRHGHRAGINSANALLVITLTLLGAALRLVSLNTRSFWLDETTAVRQASWPIPEILAQMSDNVHPPLFHILLHYWIGVFGRSEVAVRAFPVTWGIFAIPLAYWAAKTVYDRRAGLFATGLIAFSPFLVWYSQEARMYTMMLVFALLCIGSMWKAVETGRPRWWILYALATAAGTMTQYFFLFLVFAQALYLFGYRVFARERTLGLAGERRVAWHRPWGVFADAPELRGWLGAMFFAAIPLAWWIPQVLAHKDLFRGVTQPFNYGWSPPGFGIHFNEMILVPAEWIFGFHSALAMHDIVATWPLLITLAFLLAGYAGRLSDRTTYLAVSGIGGTAMIALIGTWQPILEARYFTATGAAIVLLVAGFLSTLRPNVVRPLVALLIVGALVSWIDQSYNPSGIVKWDNRQAMRIVADDYRDGDIILLIPFFVSSIPEYYLPPPAYAAVRKLPEFDARGQLRNSPVKLGEDLSRQVAFARRVWVVATWQDTARIELDRNNTGAWLTSNGYRQLRDYQLNQIRVTLYEGKRGSFFIPNGGRP